MIIAYPTGSNFTAPAGGTQAFVRDQDCAKVMAKLLGLPGRHEPSNPHHVVIGHDEDGDVVAHVMAGPVKIDGEVLASMDDFALLWLVTAAQRGVDVRR